MAIIVKTLTCIARTDTWTHVCTRGQNKCMRTQTHAHSNAMCASSVGGFSVRGAWQLLSKHYDAYIRNVLFKRGVRTCSDADVILYAWVLVRVWVL